MITFGQNIYLWRIFRGFSQKELAKKADIPRPNLSAIESGKREVTLTTLRALSAALCVGAGKLVDGLSPLEFKNCYLSRQALEKISEISLGRNKGCINPKYKVISNMLSSVLNNKINARNKIYKEIRNKHRSLVTNWLMLKSALGAQRLNSLITRLDKYI